MVPVATVPIETIASIKSCRNDWLFRERPRRHRVAALQAGVSGVQLSHRERG
jgi:hypothetical protein